MRSALYYPHTEMRSRFLLRSCLLMWDKVRFLVPYPDYQPSYSNRDVARAIELVGVQHFPTTEQKERAHEFILDLATRKLPEAFFYTQQDDAPEGVEFRIFQDKLLRNTWDVLREVRLAGRPMKDSGVPITQQCGLAVMSILADCCAGTTLARVTDRAAAYSAVVGLLADQADGLLAKDIQAHEQLVPISLRVVNTDDVDLKRLIEFREREERSSGHSLRDLRHRYVSSLDSYAQKLTAAENESDVEELKRQFEDDMKDDLRNLRDELRYNKKDIVFSKEVIGTGLATAGSFLALRYGIPAEQITVSGLPAAIFGGFSAMNKYQKARRDVLQKHPMAYLFEMMR